MKTYTTEFKTSLVSLSDIQNDEAFSSIASNEQFNYLAFVLTDDQPNANKQRIPESEFENLIKTGMYAPLKMAYAEIEEGHDNAVPLGPITHLVKSKNMIKGIAALWTRERPEDVELLKKAYAEDKPLNISWEIRYTDSKENEDGIEELLGTSLRAATLVGFPAYKGRTPVTAVASKNKEDDKLDDEKLVKLETKLEVMKEKLDATETKLEDTKTNLLEAVAEKEELTKSLTELKELREFKAKVEEKEAEEEKLASIKDKFSKAGIEKDDSYFDINRETLLSLDENALDFMIQELVSFSSLLEDFKKSKKDDGDGDGQSSVKVPKFSGDLDDMSPKELGRLLREQHLEKE